MLRDRELGVNKKTDIGEENKWLPTAVSHSHL
jgi:hypothetical protein